MKCSSNSTIGFIVLASLIQIVNIIIFANFTDYADNVIPTNKEKDPEANSVNAVYGHFQDVQVMIFVGFGFLMTFLRRYGFSSVGINMFLSGILIQTALLVNGIPAAAAKGVIPLNVTSLLNAEFALATVLISFGAVLGKLSPFQYLLMGEIELFLFLLNEHIGRHIFHVTDCGDSIFVHTFGAYFGLAISMVMTFRNKYNFAEEESSYTSDLFAMVGTTFLWVFWPSFNSAGSFGQERGRAILNTIFSLLGSTATTFIVLSLLPDQSHETTSESEEKGDANKKKEGKVFSGKFNMVMVQNSTLAGGVAIGAVANLMVSPFGAILIGCIAGTISVFGYRFLTPCLNRLMHDTCGVHNLHGMPGVISGILSGIFAALATQEKYGESLGTHFYHLSKAKNLDEHKSMAIVQGGYQIAALIVTIVISIAGGLITGIILRCLNVFTMSPSEAFHDEPHWHVPEDEYKPLAQEPEPEVS